MVFQVATDLGFIDEGGSNSTSECEDTPAEESVLGFSSAVAGRNHEPWGLVASRSLLQRRWFPALPVNGADQHKIWIDLGNPTHIEGFRAATADNLTNNYSTQYDGFKRLNATKMSNNNLTILKHGERLGRFLPPAAAFHAFGKREERGQGSWNNEVDEQDVQREVSSEGT